MCGLYAKMVQLTYRVIRRRDVSRKFHTSTVLGIRLQPYQPKA